MNCLLYNKMGSYPGIEDLPTILLEDVNFYNKSRVNTYSNSILLSLLRKIIIWLVSKYYV